MRTTDDMPDPEIAATLAAIDATLAGEALEPRSAEIAELSLFLAAGRAQMPGDAAGRLDDRLAAGFAPRQRPRSRWAPARALGAGAGALAAILAGVVVLTSGGGTAPVSKPALAVSAQPAAPSAAAAAGTERRSAPLGALHVYSNGRKVIQSATLALGVPADRIEAVAQEAFDAVGRVNGIVDSSSVTSTGGPDGNAQFHVRVSSSSLPPTMAALSRLRYANVVSRTDSSEDVNPRFVDAGRQLADAQALRTALLKQLQGASTPGQIDALKAQIRDAEGTVAGAQATLRALGRQVDYSQINLSIQASAAGAGAGGGFGLDTALHDALRVLSVAAGVALIGFAALIPLGLLGLLAWWSSAALRRRRREDALDRA